MRRRSAWFAPRRGLAGQLNTDWHAIYVETPDLQRLAAARREKILATLNLAQELGATTAVIASAQIAESIICLRAQEQFVQARHRP